jgi:hypothetical protein
MGNRGFVPAVIESRAAGPRIVHTTIAGHATLALSDRGLAEFVQVIATMDRPVWVSDSSGLTGHDSDTLGRGRDWFTEFKRRHGKHVIVVSEWSIAMMAARAMGAGASA